MPHWKPLLLSLYYHAGRPLRAWWRRLRAERGDMPIIVLYWHRIADDRATPWTVSTAQFFRQINWLRGRFQLVSLAEVQRRLRQGCNRAPCASITFDDGYADNCRRAVPWLIEQNIPCTYFVTLQNVLYGEPFAHDVRLGFRLEPNSIEQLREMAEGGVEIGAHTYTHPDLAAISDPSRLRRELIAAKQDLQAALDRPVRYFAFPFGQRDNLSPEAFEMTKKAGYAAVCSAYGGYNFPGDDPFHLQRIPVDETMARLKNWATIDPRKLRTQRYEYRAGSVEEKDMAGSGAPPQVPSIEQTPPLPDPLISNL